MAPVAAPPTRPLLRAVQARQARSPHLAAQVHQARQRPRVETAPAPAPLAAMPPIPPAMAPAVVLQLPATPAPRPATAAPPMAAQPVALHRVALAQWVPQAPALAATERLAPLPAARVQPAQRAQQARVAQVAARAAPAMRQLAMGGLADQAAPTASMQARSTCPTQCPPLRSLRLAFW